MEYSKTEKNTVKRGSYKARYDKQIIHSILDSSEICNIAFNVNGKAIVQPVNYGRSGETLYIHGSHKNRMTNALVDSGEVCLSVSILDSMKLSRSAFHHSVNFRSVVVFGKVIEMKTNKEKLKGLKAIVNHFVPNRWDFCRIPNEKELKATRVLAIKITQASAKVADSPVNDNPEDYKLDFWAGEIPVKTVYEYPVSDKKLKNEIPIPDHVLDFYKSKKY